MMVLLRISMQWQSRGMWMGGLGLLFVVSMIVPFQGSMLSGSDKVMSSVEEIGGYSNYDDMLTVIFINSNQCWIIVLLPSILPSCLTTWVLILPTLPS